MEPFRRTRNGLARKGMELSQRGYLMTSILIVLFVTGAMLTLYAQRQAERGRLERGEQVGYALSALGKGFDLYIDTHHVALAAAQPSVPGVANALHPTARELIKVIGIDGVAPLPPVIPAASYKFEVRYPDNCTSSQKLSVARCRPVGLAYLDKALMRGNRVDYVALARAARVMNGRGGYSRAENPAHFTFLDGAADKALIPIVNPASKPGLLAWRADILLSPDDGGEFLRTDGENRMNATLRFNGSSERYDLTGVGEIDSLKLSSKSLDVSKEKVVAGNSLIEGDQMIWGDETINGRLEIEKGRSGFAGLATQSIRVSGDAVINDRLEVLGSGLFATDLDVSGNMTANRVTVHQNASMDSLSFETVVPEGTPCYQNLRIAKARQTQTSVFGNYENTLLICKDGSWQSVLDESMGWDSSFTKRIAVTRQRTNIGKFIYCKLADPHANAEIEWEALDREWAVSRLGGTYGSDDVICFGEYADWEIDYVPVTKAHD